jgi:predicted DNA-binding protein (MmcQ/YjbR family)
MAKADDLLEKVTRAVLALPDTELKMSWGKPHYFVAKKIFFGCNEEDDGRTMIQFKLEPGHGELLLESDPRFERSRYAGGLQVDVAKLKKGELEKLVEESYRQIAPKKSLAKLDGGAPAAAKPTPKKKSKAKKAKAKKKKKAR